MTKLIFILNIALMALFSCTNETEKRYVVLNELTNLKKLQAKEISVGVNLLMPIKTIILNDQLLVLERVSKEMFKVFDLNTLEYLYSFGNKGYGPDEFYFIHENSVRCLNDTLVLMDNFRVKKVNYSHAGTKISRTIPIKIEKQGVKNFTLLNDSIYLVDNLHNTSDEFCLINLNSRKEILSFGEYPELPSQIISFEDKYLFCKNISGSCNERNRICIFYLNMHRMKIFDYEGNLLKDVVIGNEEFSDGMLDGTQKIYTGQIYTTSDYIYSLNINAKEEDLFSNKNIRPLIEIWDWEGNLITAYQLDKEILSFAVNEEQGKIYATTLNEMNKIYEFEFPEN